ncbi:floral homeotic isoform B [Chlorella sorokiniana]|uniref:Floral homeotic isoform A n=1 Tax=Chlorella sorokiniana TaxID=3076 RepID=A0A2P6TZ38_CHLSO|nr:floral homeotic isoform A [Chlorella sorokiniana]PRW59329.1 floral homeotic isoform B [Chlorella sorokiniana]|eukprot:PRW59328.1 floral homeotic isoform A [Chlorella sorokiniana]
MPLAAQAGAAQPVRQGRKRSGSSSGSEDGAATKRQGGWDTGAQAALAYDVAALRLRGDKGPTLNLHPAHYTGVAQQLAGQSIEDVVAALRALSRGGAAARQLSSRFRGVSRHQKGKWEARVGTRGSVAGKRYMYLGLHDSEVAAAIAYDRASIREKGVDAGTNFHLAEYAEELDPTQLSEALQRGIITPADLALRQQVAAVAAAGGHPGVLLSSAAEASPAAGSPTASIGTLQLSPGTLSEPGSPDLASLLFECVCLERESPTSVLPAATAVAAPAAKAAAWQPDACFC